MKAADRLGKMQLTFEDARKLAKNRTFASWSQEGFELAKKVAYQAPDGSGILKHVVIERGDPFPEDAPEAGAKYAEKAHAVAEVQVALAGRRLAERMHELLRTQP